jgi:hypothetical protein
LAAVTPAAVVARHFVPVSLEVASTVRLDPRFQPATEVPESVSKSFW